MTTTEGSTPTQLTTGPHARLPFIRPTGPDQKPAPEATEGREAGPTTIDTTWRSDLQGLRAVAVLLVVSYHVDGPTTGGFIGVDLFFTLSGYVICRSLFAELLATDRLDLTRFYLRRARRLLPALALMLTVTMALSAAFAAPIAQLHTARVGAASALFNANNYLMWSAPTKGYFDPGVEANPLLHTWSLAVEEQFYFAVPVLLALGWPFLLTRGEHRVRNLWLVMLAISAASLALSLTLESGWLGSGAIGQTADFYLAPARGWQFAAGGLLVLAERRRSGFLGGRIRTVRDVVGFVLIGVAALGFDESTNFPGLAALVPTLGAMLVISAGGSGDRSLGPRVLSSRALVRLGDLSYSWYLWHWPLIVFAASTTPGNRTMKVVAAIVALIPAWASQVLVENPIRRRRGAGTAGTLRLVAICLLLPLAASAMLSSTASRVARSDTVSAFRLHLDAINNCGVLADDGSVPAGCTQGTDASEGHVMLVGDSNAGHLAEGLFKAANSQNMRATVATNTSCPFADLVVDSPAWDARESGDCQKFVRATTRALLAARPDVVVISSAVDFYIERDYRFTQPTTGRVAESPEGKAEMWEAALRSTLDRLVGAGIEVVVVQPVPRLRPGWEPRSMSVVGLMVQGADRLVSDRRGQQDFRSRAVVASQAAAEGRGLTLDVFDVLCPADPCSPRSNGRWTYNDSTHLSVDGSLLLADEFSSVLASLR